MNMIIARTCILVALAAVAVVPSAFAKIVPITASEAVSLAPIGALTPPPKEWAMFPDEPQAPAAQPGQPTPPVAQLPKTTGQAPSPAVGAPAPATGSIVVAPVVPAAPKRELPLGWLALTAVLSLGAALAGGSLIIRKDSTAAVDDVPVVSDAQEIGS